MSKYQIILRNIKNIRELVFPFPERKGVYVLTGTNGCGKTSLLTALSRLGNKNAFANYRSNRAIDRYNNASVEYTADGDSVRYVHGAMRWVPTPRRKNVILSRFPFTNTKFITASGTRFYTQEQIGNNNAHYTNASAFIKNAMNEIMGTDKFNDLQYITIGVIRGRQRHPHRDNKLYIVRNSGTSYSEQNFSLGERLLLNTLDELETVQRNTLVLIDEVELSLHPIAQVKFYDFLKNQAQEKELCIILSTHSSTLIKHANNRMYLENNNGIIETIEGCFPTYILRTVGAIEDESIDFIFFVEDEMAQKYLSEVLFKYMRERTGRLIYKILPVGPYDSVVRFMANFPAIGYPKNKTQAFLDADVEETIRVVREKGIDVKKCELFDKNRANISYLRITPELGIWQWIEQHAKALSDKFDEKFGNQNFSIENIVHSVSIEEKSNLPSADVPGEERGAGFRKWAKGCFKNFIEKMQESNPQIEKKDIVNAMFESYIQNNFDINIIRATFEPLFNRR